MRVRLFELRLLAGALSLLWAVSGIVVLVAYRPGGPWDLAIGLTAMLPLLVSVSAIVWPPLVTSNRGSAGVFWIGLVAGLLLVPSLADVIGEVLARRSTPLLPSLEVVYPWALALFATALFAGLGISRQVIVETGVGPRRLGASVAFAAAASLLIGGAFAGVSLADDISVSDRPAAESRFGPTDATLVIPRCEGALVPASTAVLEMHVAGEVDGRSIGTVDLNGSRSGSDVSWTAWVYSRDLFVKYGEVRIGPQVWTLEPGVGWAPAAGPTARNDLVDSTAIARALSAGNRATAEDRGYEYVEGARARRCRVAVDGTTFASSFPQVAWLTGQASMRTWRGEIDYWIFGDREVGQIQGMINGESSSIVPNSLLATVNVMLTATDRGEPVHLTSPVR